MLAHKVDADLSTSYSDMLPADLKLERQNENHPENYHNWRIECNLFSDTSELVTHPEIKGQPYLHCPVIVEDNEVGKDLDTKPE